MQIVDMSTVPQRLPATLHSGWNLHYSMYYLLFTMLYFTDDVKQQE